MLLTNFASGELSENLFGRTDLPRYYQAAARIENFDIIPSGGIEKRRGTRRVLAGLTDGRLVPFIISRDEAYLLFFTDQTLTVYRAGQRDAPAAVFTAADISGDNRPETFYGRDEIETVQHAQNYNLMVLVHENHPPVELKRVAENTFEIAVFRVNNIVEIKCAEDFRDKDEFTEYDEKYDPAKEAWLVAAGNYPRAVTFFNSRILFAGTERTPQRIFASRVDDIHDFSTYKKFLTEKRAYITLGVEMDFADNSVRILNAGELANFTKPYEQYYVDSKYFPEGTRVTGIGGDQLYFTRDQNRLNITAEMIGAFMAGFYYPALADNDWHIGPLDRPYVIRMADWDEGAIHFRVLSMADYRIGEIRVRIYSELPVPGFFTGEEYYFYLNRNSASEITGRAALEQKFTQWWRGAHGTDLNRINNQDGLTRMLDDFFAYIRRTMIYRVSAEGNEIVLYGTPGEIREQLESQERAPNMTLQTILPLYTREVAEDRYPSADDGFTFELTGDRNDRIRWLVYNKYLVAGTETAEYALPPEVNAVNVYARLNSFYGSSRVQATSAGDAVLFFRDGNRGLAEYYIPQADSYFRTNDLLHLAGQMLRESAVADFDIAASPYTLLIITRADGTLVTLLYDRSFGVFAWSRYSTAGNVKSLAVIPGQSGYDDLYLLTGRNGEYFLELAEYGVNVFLDSFTRIAEGAWPAVAGGYDTAQARIVRVYTDEAGTERHESLPPDAEPDRSRGGEFYIGYPYTARVRTMPVLANNQMKKQRITGLAFRFPDSLLPPVTSVAGGRIIKTGTIAGLPEPFSGVHRIPFPGTRDDDVQAELTHGEPGPVKILAINAEVQ